MELSADGKRLSSTDRTQAFVSGTKMGGAATSESAAASPPRTSIPPPAPAPAATTARDPAKAHQSFETGRRLAASGNCREAMPHLNQAIQLHPRFAKAYSDRGRCSAQLGQLTQGLADLDRAVQFAQGDMSPYFNRAALRADAGDGDGALADLDRSILLDPMNPSSRIARGALLETAGRARESKADIEVAYRQIDILAPKRRPILDHVLKTWRAKRATLANHAPASGNPIEAAAASMKAGKTRAALATLDAALQKTPNDDALLALRARLRLDLGQAAAAVEDLTAFLQRTPNPYTFTDRGRAYRQLARFREELADYDRAIRQDPSFAPAYLERAFTMTYYQKGNDPTPYLTKVIELDPRSWRAYYLRGQEYGYWNNKLHLATADYRRVVELKPDHAQAYCNMAFALREAQRMNEVDGWLQKCYALDPAEREVTRKVFAKIRTKEEQAARDLAAMSRFKTDTPSTYDLDEVAKRQATTRGECEHARGNWAGAYGCN
jgi:tetratricopeptide (TPR) repeat protein